MSKPFNYCEEFTNLLVNVCFNNTSSDLANLIFEYSFYRHVKQIYNSIAHIRGFNNDVLRIYFSPFDSAVQIIELITTLDRILYKILVHFNSNAIQTDLYVKKQGMVNYRHIFNISTTFFKNTKTININNLRKFKLYRKIDKETHNYLYSICEFIVNYVRKL